jgi:protein-disulfide isomerase
MLRSRSQVQLAIAVALAAVVVVAAIVISSGGGTTGAPSRSGAGSAAEEAQALYAGIPQQGIRLGRRNAPATVVEIADLQCPFCAQYSNGAMPAIVKDYVRAGRVSYELHFRSFLGRDSVRAAGAAAEAANENRMYQFADLFYRNQGAENSGYADAAFIRSIASQVPGLDAAKVVAAADDPLSYPAVRRGEEFARGLGSTGTPDFYLRRRGSDRLVQLQPQGTSAQAYEQAIDAALAAS